MAAFKTIVPVLKVADIQRAMDFYTGVVGFTLRGTSYCQEMVRRGKPDGALR